MFIKYDSVEDLGNSKERGITRLITQEELDDIIKNIKENDLEGVVLHFRTGEIEGSKKYSTLTYGAGMDDMVSLARCVITEISNTLGASPSSVLYSLLFEEIIDE